MQLDVLTELSGALSLTQWLLFFLVLLLLLSYIYATNYHGVWEKHGVPGPKPWPILDHTLDLKKGVDAAFREWFQKYGDTFGAYGLLPHRATLVTKDLSLVKQILVKDFNNFSSRIRPQKSMSSIKDGISSAAGNTWRRHRQVTSPMFTGARMKLIMNHVCVSAENLTHLVKQHMEKGELIPVRFVCSKFSAEVIARVGFGIASHEVSKEESEFAVFSRNFAKSTRRKELIATSCYFFPLIDNILRFFKFDVDFVDETADNYFVTILKSAIEERKEKKSERDGQKARDMLDFFIEAAVENEDPRLRDTNSKTLSTKEIIGNSTSLIIAGVETVSITLQSILYCLVLYPEIQDKVVAEVFRVVPPGVNLVYEHLQELKYTTQVINECLRLFPLFTSLYRLTNETKKYNGVKIPKGCAVQIPTGLIMKDPKHWVDPEKFDPDRFSPENKANRDPLAFMPFGYGPRTCLGMRLALMELKVILVYLLREVRFTLSERTEPKRGEDIKLEMISRTFVRPVKPVLLEVHTRE
ncbi:unnamed protein product [Candidula unifasciata]|uniref:Cytochrome P450 n=1 Tax=Candidula unifasciata TaxID=100452 RepID=A0A8S4A358_9EUPU|nr:unnamed protein product [Candidula unifasciata]